MNNFKTVHKQHADRPWPMNENPYAGMTKSTRGSIGSTRIDPGMHALFMRIPKRQSISNPGRPLGDDDVIMS